MKKMIEFLNELCKNKLLYSQVYGSYLFSSYSAGASISLLDNISIPHCLGVSQKKADVAILDEKV